MNLIYIKALVKKLSTPVFLSILILLIGQFQVHAAKNQPHYVPGFIYVKLKNESGAVTKRKAVAQPHDEVQKMMQHYGLLSMAPFWNQHLQQLYRHYKSGHPFRDNTHAFQKLQNIYTIRYSADIDPKLLAQKIEHLPGVEYASPKYLRFTQFQPNDPDKGDYLSLLNFDQAWDVARGINVNTNHPVVIGIVDSGVDYTHNELDDKAWINQDELPGNWSSQLDSNNDGLVTSTEVLQYLSNNNGDYDNDGRITLKDAIASGSPMVNGSDTDGNGYADDLLGWDFWESGYTQGNIVEDNNPIGEYSPHGTHVAGIAAAETNNNRGIAGTGFNARFMAVKAGGAKDDPSTPNVNESDVIGFGMEGIMYAALNGADIINCSWGGGSFSQMEQDILNFVSSTGAVVICAAGNNGTAGVIYPASYNHTLAVGSIDTSYSIASYSNFGLNVDVFATGSHIHSTVLDNSYANFSGTSMATPVVSGLAALVKGEHPGWSAPRIQFQIRTTASFIDNKNSSNLNFLLGHGSIDAQKAVTSNMPGLKVLNYQFLNNNNEKLDRGEDGYVQISLVNFGKATQNLSLSLTPGRPKITVSTPTQNEGTIAHDDTVQVRFPLSIAGDYDLTQKPAFLLQYEDPSSNYKDFSFVIYSDILFDVIAENHVKMSMAADGTIGFTDPFSSSGGVGFVPRCAQNDTLQDGPNLLFEGGLMITARDSLVADAVRESSTQLSRDFNPESTFRLTRPGKVSGEDGVTKYSVDKPALSDLEITMHSYSFNDQDINKVIFTQYHIKNKSYTNHLLQNLYVGLFNDWDIGTAYNNAIRYSAADSILYVYDQDANSQAPYYVAVAPMNRLSGALAIDNAAQGNADNLNFGIYNQFTDQEKRAALTSGTTHTSVSGTDVSAVVGSGPFSIGPRASIDVGFIYAYGKDLAELKRQISAARSKHVFEPSSSGSHFKTNDIPKETKLFNNYPNPFNPSTNIRYDLASDQDISLTVFNILGQKVETLANGRKKAGIHTIQFSGSNLSSGIYFVVLKSNAGVETQKINLVK